MTVTPEHEQTMPALVLHSGTQNFERTDSDFTTEKLFAVLLLEICQFINRNF